MNENGVITNIEQLTPERLTNIFKKKGFLSHGKVSKIIKKNSIETETSNYHFLDLNFSNNAQTESVSPEIYVTISKPNDIAKLLGKHEVKFYSIVAETMNEMPILTCYDAAFSEETGLSHIIIETLSKTHINLMDAPLPPLKRYCERAIDCLAKLHALWWDHQKLQELSNHSFVFNLFKENSFNEKEILSWFKKENGSLKRLIRFVGERMSNRRKELFNKMFSLYPQLACERIKKKNITLIHANAHFWSFTYPQDIENEKYKAILFDWSTWGIGVGGQDLAFMIGFYWYPERRHLMEKDLVKRYHSDLLKFGVKDYSWDECWYDYKLSTLLNLYRVAWLWSLYPNSGIWWGSLERSILTVEDLNCIELLESKL